MYKPPPSRKLEQMEGEGSLDQGSATARSRAGAAVFVIGEEVPSVEDEAQAILVRQLTRRLSQLGPTQLYTIGKQSAPDAIRMPGARPLLSIPMALELWRHRPAVVFYVFPATVFAMLRARLFSILSRGARVVIVSPQPARRRRWSGPLARMLWPALVMVDSQAELQAAQRVSGRAARFMMGVDTRRFRPAAADEKRVLRKRWGLPAEGRIVLHVGHLKRSRNLGVMIELARRPGVVPVMLASALRSPESEPLRADLARAGVLVLDGYQADIEDLYRAADCYVFPVRSHLGAVAMPLSVLEALACDVPVATTRFGVLPELFAGVPGVIFGDSDPELVAAVERLLEEPQTTSHLVEKYSWEAAVNGILEQTPWPAPTRGGASGQDRRG
jgi:glycosyltransferase involved in cell wall biosynthesis